MINIISNAKDMVYIFTRIYKSVDIDEAVDFNDCIRNKLPAIFKMAPFDDITEDKICVTVNTKGPVYKIILNRKDNWNKVGVTEKMDREIRNRFEILKDGNRFEINEINPEFRRKCESPYSRCADCFNPWIEDDVKEKLVYSELTPDVLEETWINSSLKTYVWSLTAIRFALDYHYKELMKLSKANGSSKDLTLSTSKYEYAQKTAQMKKAEVARLIKKNNKKSVESGAKLEQKVINHSDAEVEDLKKQLREAKSDAAKFKELFEEEKKKTENLNKIQKQAEKDRFELEKLRQEVKRKTYNADETAIPFDKMVDTVKNTKILIIGGHKNWHNRLSEHLKNLSTIDSDEYNGDFNVIYGADRIYFFTGYIGHGVYNKALDMMREHNIDNYGYINNTNLEQNIAQIYEDCKA